MSKAEQKIVGQEIPDWLVGWEKELLEKGQASLVTVTLTTGLKSISDPPPCYACEQPTIKAFVPHSVVSDDQRLIIGTPALPGYRCEECRERPDLIGRAAHYSRSFGRDVVRTMRTGQPGRLLNLLGSYTRNFGESVSQTPQDLGSLYYLSKEGLFEFETTAAQIFRSRGYTTEADLFLQPAERNRT